MSQLELDELVFTINTNQQGANQGCMLERFLGRAVNTSIPNSLAKNFGFEEAIQARAEIRMKRFLKPEKGTKLLFAVGELVRIQNPKNKEWDSTGVIDAIRIAKDGRVLSYDINLTNGGTTVRHRKYLMKVVESLPDVDITREDSDMVADSGRAADRGVTRPGTGEGSLVVSAAEEAVTMPLADQARATGRSEQLVRLRPRGQK